MSSKSHAEAREGTVVNCNCVISNESTSSREDSRESLPGRRTNKHSMFFLILAFIAGAVFIAKGSGIPHNDKDSVEPESSLGKKTFSTFYPSSSPSSSPISEVEVVLNLFLLRTLVGFREDDAYFKTGTPQWRAKLFMANDDALRLDPTDERNEEKIIQRFALATIFFSMSGEGSMKVDWIQIDECNSDNIRCDENGVIRALEIDNSATGGTIPEEIGLLSGLENLVITNNASLKGTIPNSIQYLVHLRQLSLYNNALDGSFPEGICSLQLLKYLNLSENNFSGRLSYNLGQLSNLERLILDNNKFTGNLVPAQLRKTRLRLLSISGNAFTAEIYPIAKTLHKTLEYLYIDNNNFSGELPSELGTLTKLKSLSLSQNHFSGSVPSELSNLSGLYYLNLAGNLLKGTLAESRNTVAGAVPGTLCNLRRSHHLTYLLADCDGPYPTVTCECCTHCKPSN